MSEYWIQTRKGTKFDLLSPDPATLDIEEIAHSLSLLCRFTGHTRRFMSVAQHSVIVSELTSPESAFDGLMHDATEAYVGDVSRPLKRLLPDYKKIEDGVAAAISLRFGVSDPLPEAVKVADNVSLLWERRDLMSTPPESWSEETVLAMVPDQTLDPWPSEYAAAVFLRKFHELGGRP